jgi:hypothetical protein
MPKQVHHWQLLIICYTEIRTRTTKVLLIKSYRGLLCQLLILRKPLCWAYVKDMKQCSSFGWVHNTFGSQL